MPKRKRSTNSAKTASKVQEADPVLPSLEEIAEALKGESLEMVDWSPEEKAKMLESYQTKGAPDPVVPSLDEIAEALKGEDLATVDFTPEEKAKMQEYYRNKAQKTNPQTPTQEKLEQTKQPKTTPKKES